jgi:hypothetical protein
MFAAAHRGVSLALVAALVAPLVTGVEPAHAAATPVPVDGTGQAILVDALPAVPTATVLLPTDITPLEAPAVAAWGASGYVPPTYAITDLATDPAFDAILDPVDRVRQLAVAVGSTITFDDNAAGHGWYLGGTLAPPGPADPVDLLTVLTHEFGHLLGFADLAPTGSEPLTPDAMMAGTITTGVRRSAPTAGTWTVDVNGSGVLVTTPTQLDFNGLTIDSSVVSDVVVVGGPGDDDLSFSGIPAVPVAFDGGDATVADAIFGPDDPTTYSLTAPGAGGFDIDPTGGVVPVGFTDVEFVHGGFALDALALPAGDWSVAFGGPNAGTVFDAGLDPAIEFLEIDSVDGAAAGVVRYSASVDADIVDLVMQPDDVFVVDVNVVDTGTIVASANVLTVTGSATLQGTLEITTSGTHGFDEVTAPTPVDFLFAPAPPATISDFDSYVGLDLGAGSYVELSEAGGLLSVAPAGFADGIEITFDDAATADSFVAFVNAAVTGTTGPVAANATVTLDGQAVSGSATFTEPIPNEIQIDIDGAVFRFGDDTDDLITVSAASDPTTLTLTPAGLTGTIVGSVASSTPELVMTGDATITIDSATPAIPAISTTVTTPVVTVSGKSVVPTGDLTLARLPGPPTIVAIGGLTGATITFGNGSAQVVATLLDTVDAVPVTWSPALLVESVGVTLRSLTDGAPDVATEADVVAAAIGSAAFVATIDTSAGPASFAFGANTTITVDGRDVSGDIVIRELYDPFAQPVVVVDVANGTYDIELDLDGLTDPVVALSGGTGSLVIEERGIAGTLTGQVALSAPGLSESGITAVLELNSGESPVVLDLSVGTTSLEIVAPAGPVVRVRLTGVAAELDVASYGTAIDLVLTGDMVAELNGSVVALAFDGISATATDAVAPDTAMFATSGALVLSENVVAGSFSADADAADATQGTFDVAVNTNAIAVDESVVVDGVAYDVAVDATVEREVIWIVEMDGDATIALSGTQLTLTPSVGTASAVESGAVDGAIVVGGDNDDDLTVDATVATDLTFSAGGGDDDLNLGAAPTATQAVSFIGGAGSDVVNGPDAAVHYAALEGEGGDQTVSFFETENVNAGTNTNDFLVLPAADATVAFDGTDQGVLLDSQGSTLTTFSGVENYDGTTNSGAHTFTATATSSIGTLTMDAADRLLVDVTVTDTAGTVTASAVKLDVTGASTLAGTLEIRVSGDAGLGAVTAPAPIAYLQLDTAPTGDFAAFVGLDLGGGSYVLLTSDSSGGPEVRSLEPASLIRNIAAVFTDPDDASQVYAFLSGALAGPVTADVTLQVGGQSISGEATFTSAGGGSFTIALTDVTVLLGDPDDPVVSVTGASLSLTVTPNTETDPALDNSNVTGSFNGDIESSVAGFGVSGTVAVAINAQSDSPISASATGLAVTVNGQTIAGGGSITIERVVTTGIAELRVSGLAGQTLQLGGSPAVVTATIGQTAITESESNPETIRTYDPVLIVSSSGIRAVAEESSLSIDGNITVGNNGATAPVTVTVGVVANGVTIGGSFSLLLDTTAESPVFQLAATGLTFTVDGRSITGDVVISEVPDTDGTGTSVLVGVSNLEAELEAAGTPVVALTDGQGAFLLSSDGIAGAASVTAAAAIGGFAISAGSTSVVVNTTGAAAQASVDTGAAPTVVDVEAGTFVRVRVDNASAQLTSAALGDLTLAGNLLFEYDAVAGVTVLGVSDLNLTLAGSSLFAGEGALIVSADGIAGVISGRASASFGDVEIGGRLGVRVNSTGAAVADTTVTVGDRTFTIGFTEDEVLEVFGSIDSFDLAGFVTIQGSITFSLAESGTANIAIGTVIFLGEGPAEITPGNPNPAARGFKFVTTAAGTLTRVGAGADAKYSVSLTGDVDVVGVSGVTATATGASLEVDTITPDAEVLEIEATSLALDVGGQSLTAGSAFLGRHTTAAGDDAVAASLSGVTLQLQAGSPSPTTLVDVSNGAGALLLTAAGAAASLSGDVAIAGGTVLNGASISINSTGAAVAEEVAGTLLQIDTGDFIDVAVTVPGGDPVLIGGLSISGDFAFSAGPTAIDVSIADGAFTFGEFSVTGVNGSLSWDGANFTGSIAGAASYVSASPAVNISGEFEVGLAPALSIAASGLTIELAGYSLSGSITFDNPGSDATAFTLADGVVRAGVVEITGLAGMLDLSATGLANATLSGAVSVSSPGSLVVTGTVAITVDEDAATAAEQFSIAATVTNLEIGDIVFLSGADPPATVEFSQNGGGDALVTVTNFPVDFEGFSATVTGSTLITDSGVAASISVDAASLETTLASFGSSGPPVSLTFASAAVEINTLPYALSAPALPAGPYARLAVDDLDVNVDVGTDSYGVTFDAAIEYRRDEAGAPQSLIGVTDLQLTLGTPIVSNGSGAFLVAAGGIAGVVSGETPAGPVSVGFNSTGEAVNESIEVGGETLAIILAVDEVTVVGSDLSLDLGGFVTFQGSVAFSTAGNGNSVFAAADATLFMGTGPYLTLRDAQIGVVRVDATNTYAVSAAGTLELVGVAGVTVLGAATIEFNNTGGAVNRTVTVGDVSVNIDVADGVTSFSSEAFTVEVGGQQISGAASFTSAASDITVTFSEVDASFGGGLVTVNGASGSFVVGPTGVAGSVSATADPGESAVSIGAGTGISVAVGAATVSVDTTSGTPAVGISTTGAGLEIGGVTITADVDVVAIEGRLAVDVDAGSATVDAAAGLSLGVSAIDGLLLLDDEGVAGRLAASVAATVPDLVDLTGTLQLVASTRTTAISETVSFGGVVIETDLPAGPYLRFEGTGIGIATANATVTGNVVIERSADVFAVAITEAELTLGTPTLASISNGEGLFGFTTDGVFGRATGTLAIDYGASGGPEISGTASIALNTAGTAQNLSVTVGGETLVAAVGPNLAALSISGAVIDVAGVRVTADELNLTTSGSDVVASGDNLNITVEAAGKRVIGVAGASFALEVRSDGVAVAVRGTSVLGPELGGDLTLTAADVAVDVNTSATAASLTVPGVGSPVAIAAATATGPTVSISAGTVEADILGVAATADALTFVVVGSTVEATGTNVAVTLGVGDDRVVGVTSADLALRVTDAGVAAVVANATIAAPEIGGVVIGGANLGVTVLVNTVGAAQQLTVGATAVVSGTTYNLAAAAPGSSYVRVELTDAELTVPPAVTFTADRLVFEREGSTVTVDGTDVSLDLKANATRILTVEDADLGLRFAAEGITAAVANASVTGPAPIYGVTFSAASVSAFVNTVQAAVTLDVGGEPVEVAAASDAGGYARVELADAEIGVAGSTLEVAALVVEADGGVVRAAAADLSFQLVAGVGGSAVDIVGLSGADVGLTFDETGAAGVARNGVISGPDVDGVTLAGTVSLVFNTTTSAIDVELIDETISVPGASPAPFLAVEVSDAVLDVFGNQLTADTFAFERSGNDVTVAGTGLGLVLEAAGRRVVSIQNATAGFLFTTDGVAGGVEGGEVLGPDFGDDFSLSGTFSVEFNNTTTAHTNIGGTTIDVDAAPVGGQYLRVEVESPSIGLLGAALTATSIQLELISGPAESTVRVSVAGLQLSLSDGSPNPVLVIDVASAEIEVDGSGVFADIAGATVSTNNTGLTFAGALGLTIDTRNPANQFVRVTLTGLTPGATATISFGTQSLGGNFFFEQVQATAGRTVVKVAASDVNLDLGGFVQVTGGNGILLVSELGLAGSFSVTVALTLPTDVDIIATSFTVEVNSTSAAVSESLTVAGDTIDLQLAAGPYVQVVALGTAFYVGTEAEMTADVYFRKDGADTFFAVDNFSVTIDGDDVGNGAGAFLITATGIAGFVTASVQVNTGPVTGGATGRLDINSTGAAVSQSFTFGTQTFDLDLPAGTDGLYYELTISDVSLNIGGFVTIEIGTGTFSTAGGAFSGVRVFLGQGPAFFGSETPDPGDDDPNPAARGVLLSNASGSYTPDSGSGLLLTGTGTLSILGIDGFQLTGTAAVTVDTTVANPVKQITIDDLTVDIAGQSLTNADLTFEKDGERIVLGIADADLSLGGGAFTLTDINGGVLVDEAGVAGQLTAGVGISAPGFSIGNATFGVALNSGAAAVDTSVTVGGSPITIAVPGGPYLRVDVSRTVAENPLTVTVGGQVFEGEFALETTSTGSLSIGATNVAATIAADGADVLTISNGEGFVVAKDDGAAGYDVGAVFSGTAELAVTDVSMSAQFEVKVNTGAAITETFTVGTRTVTIDLPVGPYLKVSGQDVDLVAAGQSLSGDFTFEKLATTVTVDVANGALALGDGTTDFLSATAIAGQFVIVDNAGTAELTANLTVGDLAINAPDATDFSLTAPLIELSFDTASGSFRIKVGDAGDPADLATLVVSGQTLKAAVEAQVDTDAAGDRVVLLAITGGQLALTDGTNAEVIKVTGGTGLVKVDASGVAALASGSIEAGIDGLTLSAALVEVAINTTDAVVNENFGGVALAVPAGPFVRVRVEGLTITAAGQQFGADATITKTGDVVEIDASNVTATFGDPSGVRLELRDGAGTFAVDAAGVTASASGVVELVGVPGVTLNTTMAVEFAMTAGTPGTITLLRVEGSVELVVAPPSSGAGGEVPAIELAGDFEITSVPDATGTDVALSISITGASTFIGVPDVSGLDVTDGTFGLSLLANGNYAVIAAGSVSLTGGGFDLSGTVDLRISTAAGAVSVGIDTVAAGIVDVAVTNVMIRGPPLGELTISRIAFNRNSIGEFFVTTSQAVADATRTSDVATISVESPHGIVVGQTVTLAGVGGGYDGSHVVTVVDSPTSFSFDNTGADDAGGSATGTVTAGIDFSVGSGATTLDVTGAALTLYLKPDGTHAFSVSGSVAATLGPVGVAGTVSVERNTTGFDVDLSSPIVLQVPAGVTRIAGTLDLTTPVGNIVGGAFTIVITASAGADGVLGTTDDDEEVLIGGIVPSLAIGLGTHGQADFVGFEVTDAELALLIRGGNVALDARGSVAPSASTSTARSTSATGSSCSTSPTASPGSAAPTWSCRSPARR